MRTIKFRAKDFTGTWEYGFVMKGNVQAIIVPVYKNGSVAMGINIYVKPETIGQFTGLYDKNGKEIYEGDILRSPLGNIVAVEFGYKEHIIKHGRPQITDSFACYGWIARNVKNGITDFFDNEFAAGEVIGNIYDNPELIAEDMNIQIKED